MAQEKEIWACQEADTNGFYWDKDHWIREFFNNAGNALLTIDGSNSKLMIGGEERSLTCKSFQFISCTDPVFGDALFVLNRGTGEAAGTSLFAAVRSTGDQESRDSLAISLYQCTKF